MNMIAKLFQDFQALPDDFTVKGTLGTGPFARETTPGHPYMQKIILSGDNKRTIALNLWDLLYDLAVDCAWNSEQIKQLNDEFFGPLAMGDKCNQEVTP